VPTFRFRLLFSQHPDRQGTTVQIFSQAKDETVVINGEVNVTVVDILGDEVVLAIDAPEWVEVCKKEALVESETMPIHPR
jgi:carbon storage regulator CsrA